MPIIYIELDVFVAGIISKTPKTRLTTFPLGLQARWCAYVPGGSRAMPFDSILPQRRHRYVFVHRNRARRNARRKH